MNHTAFFPCQQQIPEISNEYIDKNFKGQPPKNHIILISWVDLLGKFMVYIRKKRLLLPYDVTNHERNAETYMYV